MVLMFSDASSFNGDISSWDVSSVSDMSIMFYGATSFNQPLDTWDVSSVTSMFSMFLDAESFNQNLGSWYIVLGDTKVDSGETAVTTITAQNTFLNNSQPTYAVVSGGDGNLFHIEGATLQSISTNYYKNTYNITVTATDVLGLPLSHSKDMTITVADNLGSSTTTITGTIFSDTDGNGVQDAGETGISGHEMITHDYSTGQTSSTTTAADGTYTFTDVTLGRPSLIQTGFYPQGHTLSSPQWFDYITPQEGQTVTFDIGFYTVPAEEMATLNVIVYSDDNLNGQRDSGEAGVGGLDDFYVYTYTQGPDRVLFPDATDASGKFAAQVLPADFGLFVNEVYLDDAGYIWATTSYERDDGVTDPVLYDPDVPIIRSPGLGSGHTVTIGLIPAS